MKLLLTILTVVCCFLLVSCGSSSSTVTYGIGGTISGLSGTGLVLQVNGGDNLSVSAGATTFTFAPAIASGDAYSVTVFSQPSSPAQTCTVLYGSGTANAYVGSVQLNCTNNSFTVGVTVSGLSGTGLVLQDNGGNNLSVSANGTYTFTTAILKGDTYNVTVLSQPSGPAQTCGVSNGFGTVTISSVTGIGVTCITTTVTYTIGGTVSGLLGTGLVLQDYGGDNLPVSANGSFMFATAIASGGIYSVTVLTQPSNPAQTCKVMVGNGVANANVTDVLVICTTNPVSIGGTVSGLTGTGLVLQDSGGNNLPISTNGSFSFATLVASGSNYAVTVLTQPSGQNCSVTNGSGTAAAANVTNVMVDCSGNTFNIGVIVSGLLPNTNVVLQDNGDDNLTVSTNGIATNFNTPIASGSSYAVTVLTQPGGGTTCTLGTNSNGAVTSANINIAVTCGAIIAAGESHTCALTSVGAVLCWGLNEFGQLGDGMTTNSTTPVQVSGLSSGVVSIAAGYETTCALTNAGAVWCWGYNSTGQLGNGTLSQSRIPVEVLAQAGDAPLSGVVAIASGQYHTCAVTIVGTALCWGDNSEGELGNGTNNGSNLPVTVSVLSSGVAAISAGSYFTCALTTAGTTLCWGEGGSGQLGSGNTTGSSTPEEVLDSTGNAPLSGLAAISSVLGDTCALTSGRVVLCWGANNADQPGNGTNGTVNPQSDIPVEVLNLTGQAALNGVGVDAITHGLDDSCALTSAGGVLCWGSNGLGQLSNGSNSDATTPVAVSGLSSGVDAIAAGYHHTCAVTSFGAALCWGSNPDGQLGNGSTTNSSTPVQVVGVGDIGFLQLH